MTKALPELKAASRQDRHVKVLVVDDEPGIRELLFQELTREGYHTLTAVDGKDALQKLKQERIQLVLCDINMPQLGGLDVLQAIQKHDPAIEVIMMTGYGTVESAVAAMKIGAYDFLQKPFNLDELLALVDKCLEKTDLKIMMGVYEASQSIFQSIQLENLLPRVAELSLKVFKADDVSIMVLEHGQLIVKAAAGLRTDPRKLASTTLGDSVAGRAALRNEPMLITGPLENEQKMDGLPRRGKLQSSIVYPFVIDGNVLGVININRTQNPEPFLISDLHIATIFSSQIAQAVYNAQLYKELEEKVAELKTAKQKLEETQMQLIQSEKLAGIGQLAAGVAHELNNPLSGVMGFSQLLLEDPSLTPGQRKDLETIQSQSQRCRVIIQNLLQFSRRKDPKKEPLDLTLLINVTADLVKYDFSTSGIDILQKTPPSLPLVYGDPHQLQQILLNLLTNARQAMEQQGKGELVIEAGRRKEFMFVQVKDTGHGIPKEIMNKIFEPFFTTKPVGKGTGLGLSICYGIAQQHQGNLTVESEVGKGTTFTLELPIYE